MFSDNKNKKKRVKSESHTQHEQNKIAKDTVVTGDIQGEGVFRIEGKLIGNLKTTRKIVIGQTGVIEGDVICGDADVEGGLKGTLRVENTLNLKSTCNIEGDVSAGRLSVEPGASLNGTCTMKENDEETKAINGVKKKKKRKETEKAEA